MFLGLASFYRRLVPNFAELAKPLMWLTRKNQEFNWVPGQQETFKSLKDKLSPPPCWLTHTSNHFILTTDVSKFAVATILSQVQDGMEHPIAYTSRQTNTAEQAYSASEAEMLALVWATKFFHCSLHGDQGRTFMSFVRVN